jgi:hypothetical protein
MFFYYFEILKYQSTFYKHCIHFKNKYIFVNKYDVIRKAYCILFTFQFKIKAAEIAHIIYFTFENAIIHKM